MDEGERIRIRRKELKHLHGEAYVRLSEILFAEDPISINFEENTDEYEPEVETVLPRLSTCRSVDDVQRVLHEEFAQWFGVDTAGPPAHYERIAKRIWDEVVPGLIAR